MLPTELKKAISVLQSALNEHNKISIAHFSNKLNKISEQYPEDQTINQMSLIVNRMNSGNKLFISQPEVKELYRRLYSHNTKFASFFHEELGIEAEKEPAPSITEQKYEELDIYAGLDNELKNQLSTSFDPQFKPFSAEIGKQAEVATELECTFQDLEPKVKAVSGNSECVIVEAKYQTPKGKVSVYVPVEFAGENAVVSGYFQGKDGTHFISKASIAKYVDSYFDKVGSHGNVEVGEEVAFVEEEQNTAEIEQFASKLSTAKGIAVFQHGDNVEKARRLISKKMVGFGKRAHQVNVLDANENGITFGIKCQNLAFKVPVKVESGRVVEPEFLLCNGGIEEFTADGLANLSSDTATDNQIMAAVSPMFELTEADLVDTVSKAASDGNYARAEDALNVLAMREDGGAYRVALSMYQAALSAGTDMKKEASVKHKCSRIVKSANSTQLLCGHLNLPLNKTFVDGSGDCRPNHAKNSEINKEDIYFMNSKIFF